MKRVFASRDALLLGHLKNVLAIEGIASVIRHLDLSTGAGELPPIECWPELWVVDGSDEERARTILDRAIHAPPPPAASWRCSGCGERHEGQFTECWKCGRPAALGEG